LTFAQISKNTKADSPESINNQLKHISPLSEDLSRAVLSQLSILITKLDQNNCFEVIRQIHNILDKHQEIFPIFIRRLINQASTEIIDSDTLNSSNSYTLKVLRHEIHYLTLIELHKVNYISQALLVPESQFLLFSIDKFLSFFDLTEFQCLLIALSIEQFIYKNNLKDKHQSLLKDLPTAYVKYSSGVVQWLDLLENSDSKIRYNLSTFLTLFLNSEIFSVPHKFIVLSHISASFKSSKTKLTQALPYQTKYEDVNIIINQFLNKLQKMNFKELILDFCNTKSNPDKLLSDLLSIQPEGNLSESVLVLLLETLNPGSQQKPDNQGKEKNPNNLLTASNLPEATARGARMLQVLLKIKDKIDWDFVFDNIIQSFIESPYSIEITGFSQFLASIQTDKLADKFLSKVCASSHIQLLRIILLLLNDLDPNAGAVDIFSFNLTPILQTETNVKHLLLYYKYIVMLEVKTVAILTSSRMNDSIVSSIFNKDLRNAPEYMILACLHLLHTDPRAAENEIIVNIMQNFFINLLDINSPYLNAIFALFEEYNATELGKLLLKYLELRKNQETIHQVASLIASFKDDTVVKAILQNCKDFTENFTIAVIFTQYGWKHLKDFISIQLEINRNLVLATVLDFLEKQAKLEYENSQQGKRPIKSLGLETVYFLMTLLSSEQLPKELFERSRNLQTLCLQAYPRLINFGQGHDSSILMNSYTNSFSVDVEKEMKLYYQKMYKKEIEIKDVVNMLQRLKHSDNPHEQDVFACMIHSLLDEYRFFPEYPVDALATTSVLFGNTIVFKLLEGPALSIALRYILESAREPIQSKMFKFAVQSLYSFMKRLPEFPKFCSMLCEIPSLKSQPELYEICQNIASGKILPNPEPEELQAAEKSLKNNILEDDMELISKYVSIAIPELSYNVVTQEIPAAEVSDRILFMINNVSETNLSARIEEMKALLKPNHYKWFSKYLVNQRAKLELNNQEIYSEFVERIKSHDFYTYVMIVTIRQIITLLNKTYDSDLTTTEKTHLKNLGSWLGKISLANDHPILRKDMSFKYLLVEGYHLRKLEYITPLVCKVLDQTKRSSVFKYPNPWLLGILQVLKELYEVADLKLTLKFEIEVLCNDLNVKLESIESSNIVRTSKPDEIESIIHSQKVILNMAKMSLNEKRGIPPITANPELAIASTLAQQQQQQQQLSAFQQIQQQRLLARAGIQNSPAISNVTPLAQQATLMNVQQHQQQQQQSSMAFEILNGETIFVTHPALKRILQLSITKAVKDLLPPLVHRTNTVCLVTTKALILKDFAFEVDEIKIRKAYINTVRYFAESLIIASSSTLIRETIQSNVQQYLQTYMNSLNCPVDPTFLEQIPLAVNDNLQLALSIIQKAAVEKAVHDLDETMLPALALRRQFKTTSPNQLFCDTQNASKYAMTLPEPLGIKPGGVTLEQFHIYDDFGKKPTGATSQFENNALSLGSGSYNPVIGTNGEDIKQRLQQQLLLQQQQQVNKFQGQIPANVLEQTMIFINQHLETIMKTIESIEDKKIILSDNVPETELIKNLLVEIIQALTRLGQQELYMKYAQITINTLLGVKDASQLFIDAFVFLLSNICDLSSFVVRYVTTWLFNSDDERKFDVRILTTFVLEGFITLNDLSYSLAKRIEATKDARLISFTCALIDDLIFGNSPIALRSDFIKVFLSLEQCYESIKDIDKVQELFKKLETSEDDAVTRLKNGLLKTDNIKDYMAYMFAEWVKLYKFSGDSKLQIAFISQLVDVGIINKPELFTQFFTVAVEVSVAAFIKENDNFKKSSIESYTAVDALAKLIIVLIAIQSGDNSNRVKFLSQFCSVLILSFANDHEVNRGNFNERPYFRFFSTLLCELSLLKQNQFKPYASSEDDVKAFNELFINIYQVLGDIFLCLQPAAFPGFTYAWVCLISHRMFMPTMIELNNEENKCCEKLCSLLVALLRFESGYVKGKIIPESITVIYKGTLRIFLVLLHDFPEFLVQWFNPLVNATSLTFIQLRNIILSAVPFDMNVPDPFQQGLKVDRLKEIVIAPIVSSDPSQLLIKKNIKKTVDNYLRIPSNSLLRQILHSLELNEFSNQSGVGFAKVRYNIELISSLILYSGISYVEERSKNSLSFNSKSSQVSLITSLMQEGDTELQFLLLEAVANNLRYPNAHTHWFSCVVLHFFGSRSLWGDKREDIQQLITRVLLERILCNKPHPWGLLVTFIELLKNKDYEFASLPFTKVSPEIESVLTSLIIHAQNSSSTAHSSNVASTA
jgi:CCR4-NOT transcription complex subunit 1